MSPTNVEIRLVARDDIYDLFVDGRFRNFYKTFGEAALAAEKLLQEDTDIVQQWKDKPRKKGKVRGR